MPHIFPSLIAADQLNLHAEVDALNPYCYGYHLDIMDNHFVPNLTWGPATVNALCRITMRIIWVHLMIEKPMQFIKTLQLPPLSIVSFHFESTNDHKSTIKSIKEKNWLASIAINPKTAPSEIFHLLDTVDQVLLMSVNPGRSGQQFLEPITTKITPIINYRTAHHLTFTLAIDGGITTENIADLARRGVDHFVVGAAIFNTKHPTTTLQNLQQLIGEKL